MFFGSDQAAWRFVLWVVGFYAIIFVAITIWEERHELVIERQLSIGNLLQAIGKGLKFPASVTLIVAVCAFVLSVDMDQTGDTVVPSWISVFAGLVLLVQALIGVILGGVGVYYVGRAGYQYILRPIGLGIVKVYRFVRPYIPIRM